MSLGVVSCFWLMCAKDICYLFMYIHAWFENMVHHLGVFIMKLLKWKTNGKPQQIPRKSQKESQFSLPCGNIHLPEWHYILVEFEMCVHRSTPLYARHGFYIVYLSVVSVSISKYVPDTYFINQILNTYYQGLTHKNCIKLHQFKGFFLC